jgi:hypothetical protein
MGAVFGDMDTNIDDLRQERPWGGGEHFLKQLADAIEHA